jgi:hypothetical protein
LLGAIVGGLVSYVVQRQSNKRLLKDQTKAALEAVEAELEDAKAEVSARFALGEDSMERRPALSTSAWEELLRLADPRVVGPQALRELAPTYRIIAQVNEYARNVDVYLPIAITSSDQVVRAAFRDLVKKSSSNVALGELQTALPDALTAARALHARL